MILDMRYHTWTRIQFMNEEGSGSADRSQLNRGKFVFILPYPTIKMKNTDKDNKYSSNKKVWLFSETLVFSGKQKHIFLTHRKRQKSL